MTEATQQLIESLERIKKSIKASKDAYHDPNSGYSLAAGLALNVVVGAITEELVRLDGVVKKKPEPENKVEWLKEAIRDLDAMDADMFESFLKDCRSENK